MEIQEAYKVLGLSEEATKEEIEKKYALLCKRYKVSLNNTDSSSEKINIQKINQAYDIVCRHLSNPVQPASKNAAASKPESLWNKYKAFIIGGIIVVALVLIVVFSV